MGVAVAAHDELLQSIVESHQGYVFKMAGDSCCAAFSRADSAVAASAAIQLELASAEWNRHDPLLVRIALHTGAPEERGNDYFGPPVNRVARLLAASHGGQTVLSGITRTLVGDSAPEGAQLVDLGQHLLRDLSEPERIYELRLEGLPWRTERLRTVDPRRSNLPIQTSSFVGRETQLNDIARILSRPEVRLLTLTGAGGSGKTRLAIQAGAQVVEEFPEGVYLVELAPLTASSQVMTAIRAAIGIREGVGGELETLIDWLKERAILLILDNFEHVLDAAVDINAILQRCPITKIMATSRTVLRVAGEQDYVVPVLAGPPLRSRTSPADLEGYESVRLFVQRAQAARYDFRLSEDNAADVATICLQLDGLPLAIELAAARVRVLSPRQIRQRLSDAQAGSLTVLSGGSRGAPTRHQTLSAAMEWSYGMLQPQSQQLLNLLSVFRGGCTFEAIETVCGSDGSDIFEAINALVDSSLVAAADERTGEPRYSLLETIRQFVDSRLKKDERSRVRQSHADFFANWVGSIHEGAQADANLLDAMALELDNLRAAISELLREGRRQEASVLVGSLLPLWDLRGYHSEGRQWCREVLPSAKDISNDDVKTLITAEVSHTTRMNMRKRRSITILP